MEQNMRVGMIGGGRIAKVHASNFKSRIAGAEIVVMADPFVNDSMRIWASELGIQHVKKDYQDIIRDPDIEAVLVCSPTDTHARIVQEAARAGKHIFCEKPLDRDPKTIRETLKVVEAAGVVFQIGFNRRFDHNFQAIRQAVSDGLIGKVHLLKITSRDPEPPPTDYIKSSGGLFMDMSIHDFDMARFLCGSEVLRVHAAGAVLIDPEIGRQGDIDTAIITLWFANGALGVIDNSRKAAYGYDQRAEIFGSKGSAGSGNDFPSSLVISNKNGVQSEKPLYFFLERYAESFAKEMMSFIKAIREDCEVPGAKAALNSVLIAAAAKQSLDSGKPVELPSEIA